MSILVQGETLSDAWIDALKTVHGAPSGRLVHVAMAVEKPGFEVPAVRQTLDKFLADRGLQPVDTVAETIFPRSLYPDPEFDWSVGLAQDRVAELDEAAQVLYEDYVGMLPLLRTASGNSRGTYFSRMISWPGKAAGGPNQVQLRIDRIRSELTSGRRTLNTLDMDIAADAMKEPYPLRGLQIYEVLDKRTRGFPCLTHIALTLVDGCLHLTAVYRHQYLIEKAYGNMVGLSELLGFICQQTGTEVGELMVHATLADAERNLGKVRIAQLINDVDSAMAEESTT